MGQNFRKTGGEIHRATLTPEGIIAALRLPFLNRLQKARRSERNSRRGRDEFTCKRWRPRKRKLMRTTLGWLICNEKKRNSFRVSSNRRWCKCKLRPSLMTWWLEGALNTLSVYNISGGSGMTSPWISLDLTVSKHLPLNKASSTTQADPQRNQHTLES